MSQLQLDLFPSNLMPKSTKLIAGPAQVKIQYDESTVLYSTDTSGFFSVAKEAKDL